VVEENKRSLFLGLMKKTSHEAEGFCAAVGCGHLGAEVCGGQEPDEGFGLGHVLQA
jgi:hypothetical protein